MNTFEDNLDLPEERSGTSATPDLDRALFAIQGSLVQPIQATKKNDSTGSFYAPLDQIMPLITPLLQENGILWQCKPYRPNPISIGIVSILKHVESGQYTESRLDFPIAQLGLIYDHAKLITYLRRYLLTIQLSLTFANDDDCSGVSELQLEAASDLSAIGASPKSSKPVRTVPAAPLDASKSGSKQAKPHHLSVAPEKKEDDVSVKDPVTGVVVSVSARAKTNAMHILGKTLQTEKSDGVRQLLENRYKRNEADLAFILNCLDYRLKGGIVNQPEELLEPGQSCTNF